MWNRAGTGVAYKFRAAAADGQAVADEGILLFKGAHTMEYVIATFVFPLGCFGRRVEGEEWLVA